MRIFLAAAAALLAAGTATPAFAQYGGSPQEQVDGAPGEPRMQAPDDADDEAVAYVPEEIPDEALQAPGPDDDAAYAGKPGAEDYAAYDGGHPYDAEPAGPEEAYEGVDAVEDDGVLDDGDGAGPVEVDQGGTWQGEDGRTYCRRSEGTTGLVVGGGAGALIGNGIDGGRRRGAGTIIGGIIGAIVGSAVERSASEQNCR